MYVSSPEIFGQRHLRTILAQYEAHYNGRHPIAAASSTRPGPAILPGLSHKRIQRRPGGLINEYSRAA